MSHEDLTCQELVEIVTEYLEGGLTNAERQHFEAHIAACGGCTSYVEQIRMTIDLGGRVRVEDLSDETKSGLVTAFRDWKREA
jgi:anti-sigma factor RsiW